MKKWVLFLISAALCTSAQAAIELELTQGVEGAIPVAILPFVWQGAGQSPVSVTDIITTDLENSGRFTLNTSATEAKPADKVNYIYWRKKGVDNVIAGEVQARGLGKYQVSMQLQDVYKGAQVSDKKLAAPLSEDHVLVNKQYTVSRKELRRVSHHLSDLIYRQLTGQPGVFATRIAYIVVERPKGKPAKFSLEVSDYDGKNAQPLLLSNQPIMSPAWSHDGRRLAYVSFEHKKPEIFIVDVTTGARKLISSYAGINSAPAFSPDDKQLALVLSKSGKPKIYVAKTDGKALQQVTFGPSIDTEPSWAPDGKSLLFTSNRGGAPQVYLLTLATNRVKRLTFDGNYNARASFSPDGRKIVMLHRSNGLFTIAIQTLATGETKLLTQSGLDESPSFAPNGAMVLYATQYGGRGVLGLVSSDGNVKLRLPARVGDVREPAWSPFLN